MLFPQDLSMYWLMESLQLTILNIIKPETGKFYTDQDTGNNNEFKTDRSNYWLCNHLHSIY